jgi:hypothetical protein
MISEETLAERVRYRALGIKIIGARRPRDLGDSGSSDALIVKAQNWRQNHRIDVLSVGKGVKEDIVPGDVIFVIPRGDSKKIIKLKDPELEVTWCGSEQDLYSLEEGTEDSPGNRVVLKERNPWQKVHAILKSIPVVDQETGEICRAVEVDHNWQYVSADGLIETLARKGDWHILPLETKHRRFCTKEDFPRRYRETILLPQVLDICPGERYGI